LANQSSRFEILVL